MRDHVILYINGRREIVRGDRLFQPLSDFLRYDRQLVGTKVVCAEGDCGSCCVLIGTPSGDKLVYRNVTSCIQYVYQLDGLHLITVEGLKRDGKLSCVQESMVSCQGSQCGFCTPGFVVSMHALLEDRQKLTDADLRVGLSGNLCRCTGYESIIKAGVECDAAAVARANELYPPGPILADLAPAATEPLLVRGGGKVFFKPTTVADAAAFKAEHPGCMIISGGTDLGVFMNKGKLAPTAILSTLGLPLRRITVIDGLMIVGAGATLEEFRLACIENMPEMARLMRRHGSPPIRNAGTLAGNIANGSPIGDTMPGLYVLNAEIELTGRAGSRRVNINDFYTGYRQTVMARDELITAVHIVMPRSEDTYKLYKISRRFDLDISGFSAAFWMQGGDRIDAIRIAYGGVGPNILRLRKTEELLTGQVITDELIDHAAATAASEISPISDVRGSQAYRFLLGENILRKFFAERRGEYALVPPPGAPGADGDGVAVTGEDQPLRTDGNGRDH